MNFVFLFLLVLLVLGFTDGSVKGLVFPIEYSPTGILVLTVVSETKRIFKSMLLSTRVNFRSSVTLIAMILLIDQLN